MSETLEKTGGRFSSRKGPLRFPRACRRRTREEKHNADTVAFQQRQSIGRQKSANSGRLVHTGLRKLLVKVVNRSARYPPGGVWPYEMRADMVAAILDFPTSYALCLAISAGDAPRPTATRGSGAKLEPVWHRESIRQFLSNRHRAITRPDTPGD